MELKKGNPRTIVVAEKINSICYEELDVKMQEEGKGGVLWYLLKDMVDALLLYWLEGKNETT